MPKSKLPLRSFLEKLIDDDDDEAWEHMDKVKVSNLAITPEVRFYLG